MPTIAQPYIYSIASIPGGVFEGQQSNHLLDLILTLLPGEANPVINSDGSNVIITFDADISDTSKTTLDSLVLRSADYFVATKDNGATVLGLSGLISVLAGLVSSTAVTLQYKNGDGTNSNGYGDAIIIDAPLMNITAIAGNFNGSGQFSFTVGSSTLRGQANITITSGSLPVVTLAARWT